MVGGGFVVAFLDANGGTIAIKAQRFDASGASVGAETTLVPAVAGSLSTPEVIGTADAVLFSPMTSTRMC